jgi:beta-glucanase (GH16 family)
LGNHELQYYTDANRKNASVANGVLRITAIKEQYEGLNYTSARLVSKNKGDFLYGRFVVEPRYRKGKVRGQPLGCCRQIGFTEGGHILEK